MGKASRRKREQQQLPYGFFVDRSYMSNKHMVWLGVRTGKRSHEQYPVTAHYRIEDALFGLSQCQKALKEFRTTHPYFDPSREYYRGKLWDFINEHFDYDDDDYVGIVNREDSPLGGLISGMISEAINDKNPRWSVSKVLMSDDKKFMYANKRFYGEPCGCYAFFVWDNERQDLWTGDDAGLTVFNSYKSAGGIADYLNFNSGNLTAESTLELIQSLDEYCRTIFPEDSDYHPGDRKAKTTILSVQKKDG